MNGAQMVAHGDRVPFAVTGPGEYEISGIFARGFASDSHYDSPKDKRVNSIYVLKFEGMKICFLGALETKDLPHDAKEMMDDIDILFVPIGGEGVLEPADAHDLAVKIEPKIIIPMHYGNVGIKDALKIYLKEEGSVGLKPVDKLTLKRKDLDGRSSDVVVLSEK